MKKIYLSFFKIILSLVILFSFTPLVYAQLGEYVPLAALPKTTDSGGKTTLATYLPAVFSLSIGIGAAMAVVMITYGGILYATTDAINGKEEGKKYITDAIVGLLLILSSWIILVTINPNMVNFSLILPKPKVIPDAGGIIPGGGTPGNGRIYPGYPLSDVQLAENARTLKTLQDANIGINNGGTPCTNPAVTSGCTNVYQLPGQAINGVIALKNAPGCNCNVQITGGTEGGHETHGPGLPRLDLAKDGALNAYIINNKFGPIVRNRKNEPVYTLKLSTGSYSFTDEGSHWHVDFAGR